MERNFIDKIYFALNKHKQKIARFIKNRKHVKTETLIYRVESLLKIFIVNFLVLLHYNFYQDCFIVLSLVMKVFHNCAGQ